MPARRKRRIVLLALAFVAGIFAFRVASIHLPLGKGMQIDFLRGAYHVHSTFSDGHGSVDDILTAAEKDHLNFVILTDHNAMHSEVASLAGEGSHHPTVELVIGEEASSEFGHLIVLGLPAPLTGDALSDHVDPIGIVRDGGGDAILAHPLNLKHPWRDWAHASEAAGMEVLSYDDLWRLALHHPFSRSLVVGLLEYPFNPRLAALQILRRPDDALARYDELRKTSDIALFCASDAHGLPSYEPILDTLVMHIGEAPVLLGDGGADIVQTLAAGQSYCGVDAIASTDGFRFVASPASVMVNLPILRPMPPTQIVVFRDGVQLAESDQASFAIPRPAPGDYRVEVMTRLPVALGEGPWVPWILSNPHRVR